MTCTCDLWNVTCETVLPVVTRYMPWGSEPQDQGSQARDRGSEPQDQGSYVDPGSGITGPGSGIRNHRPGTWDHKSWDQDRQILVGSGIRIFGQKMGSLTKKYTSLRPCFVILFFSPLRKNSHGVNEFCRPQVNPYVLQTAFRSRKQKTKTKQNKKKKKRK